MLPFSLPCAPTWITEGVCLQDDGKEVGVENRGQRRKARGVYCDCCVCTFAGPSQSCRVLPVPRDYPDRKTAEFQSRRLRD